MALQIYKFKMMSFLIGMNDSDYQFLSSPYIDDTSNKGVMGSGVSKSNLTPVKLKM